MLQLIVLLAVSWLLLWFFEKKNLSVLGMVPDRSRAALFIILFLVSGVFSASAYLLRMIIAQETYVLDRSLNIQSFLLECWHQFRTVLTEELLCRGAVLYILIRRIGRRNAILISAVFFALLHWMNAGVWGDFTQMAIVFTFTFLMGLLLAYAYTRTFSLLIPFAIHLGWNLVQNYIFPGGPAGNHVFVLSEPPPTVTISYTAFFIMLLAPKVAVLLADYLIIKRYKQVQIP